MSHAWCEAPTLLGDDGLLSATVCAAMWQPGYRQQANKNVIRQHIKLTEPTTKQVIDQKQEAQDVSRHLSALVVMSLW